MRITISAVTEAAGKKNPRRYKLGRITEAEARKLNAKFVKSCLEGSGKFSDEFKKLKPGDFVLEHDEVEKSKYSLDVNHVFSIAMVVSITPTMEGDQMVRVKNDKMAWNTYDVVALP